MVKPLTELRLTCLQLGIAGTAGEGEACKLACLNEGPAWTMGSRWKSTTYVWYSLVVICAMHSSQIFCIFPRAYFICQPSCFSHGRLVLRPNKAEEKTAKLKQKAREGLDFKMFEQFNRPRLPFSNSQQTSILNPRSRCLYTKSEDLFV